MISSKLPEVAECVTVDGEGHRSQISNWNIKEKLKSELKGLMAKLCPNQPNPIREKKNESVVIGAAAEVGSLSNHDSIELTNGRTHCADSAP